MQAVISYQERTFFKVYPLVLLAFVDLNFVNASVIVNVIVNVNSHTHSSAISDHQTIVCIYM